MENSKTIESKVNSKSDLKSNSRDNALLLGLSISLPPFIGIFCLLMGIDLGSRGTYNLYEGKTAGGRSSVILKRDDRILGLDDYYFEIDGKEKRYKGQMTTDDGKIIYAGRGDGYKIVDDPSRYKH